MLMTQPWPHRYQLWLRVTFVLIFSGVSFLGLQFADLYALGSFAPEGNGLKAAGLAPVAYVPVSKTARPNGPGLPAAMLPDIRIAEVGDGGDLGRRARRVLESYRPYLLAQEQEDVAYVALGPTLDCLGGELKWTEGDARASIILPEALITFAPGQMTALRNYQPIQMPAPVLAEYGQLRIPVKALEQLCEIKVESNKDANAFKLTRGDKTLHVIVRERMYNLEVSRSARWLHVFFLGQMIKEYPLCIGEGNNTPVGNFHIQNKAVWPPWNAYWGEYMPGGSARNPLGARWLGTTARGRATGRVIGIHGTNQPSSIGQRISGGCLRTYNPNAIELYNNIPVGTPVWVHE
jgi:hypothetical protein